MGQGLGGGGAPGTGSAGFLCHHHQEERVQLVAVLSWTLHKTPLLLPGSILPGSWGGKGHIRRDYQRPWALGGDTRNPVEGKAPRATVHVGAEAWLQEEVPGARFQEEPHHGEETLGLLLNSLGPEGGRVQKHGLKYKSLG